MRQRTPFHGISLVPLQLAIICSASAPPLISQPRPSPPRKDTAVASMRQSGAKHTFGVRDPVIHTVGAFDFLPFALGTAVTSVDQTISRHLTGGNKFLVAPVRLPAGVLVSAIEVEGCDLNPEAELTMGFISQATLPGGESGLNHGEFTTGVAETSGCGYFLGDFDSPVTVDNFDNTYAVSVSLDAIDQSVRFSAVRLYYNLQISEAPTTATFEDVPVTHTYFRAIEALAASGITTGCGNGNFCPQDNVTRGEMAAFLVRALGLHWPF